MASMAMRGMGAIPGVGGVNPETVKEEMYTLAFWAQLAVMFAVPSIIAYVVQNQHTVMAYAGKAYRKVIGETERQIVFKYSNDYWFNQSQDDRNNILQKAITLYLGAKCTNAVAELKEGQIRLMQRQDRDRSWWNESSDGSEELKKYELTPMPQLGEKQEIEPGLWFHYEEEADENAGIGETRSIHTYTFTAYGRNSRDKIDGFVNRAYQYYIDMLRREVDTGRYLYQMQIKESSDRKGKPPVYKKYKLSDDKTFESLFFEGKSEILALIDDFIAGRDKFAIEGFPNKLGLLLHGPPGTGKTSFVKALAQYTNRHIVTVPLAKITTNQELYDIMFDLVFPTKDDDGINQQLTFRDIIFLLEDIDASADVVKSRKDDGDESDEAKEMAALLKWMVADSKKTDGQVTTSGGSGGKDAAADTAAGFDVVGGAGLASLFEKADKLDLAGLLNVLDGVVDSPGRIVIMTTNHPNALDAALIRPGRINRKLHMGYMSDDNIAQMFTHHFDGVPPAKVAELRAVLHNKRTTSATKFNISGAEVEQLCAECDTTDEFIVELAEYPRLHHDLAAQVAEYNK